MARMAKRKIRSILIITTILLSITYLVYAGLRDTMIYYMTPGELKLKIPSIYGESVSMGGKVVDDSIKWDPINLKLEFLISDEKEKMKVIYQGVIPDAFKSGADVIVEGIFNTDGIFKANRLLAKCPSKFEIRKG